MDKLRMYAMTEASSDEIFSTLMEIIYLLFRKCFPYLTMLLYELLKLA